MRLVVSLLKTGIFVAIVALGYLGYNFYQFLSRPLQVAPDGFIVELTPGSGITSLAYKLEQDKVITNRRFLQLLALYQDSYKKIKAGEYKIEPNMLPWQFLQLLIEGKVVQHSFTIVEGVTFNNVRLALNENPLLKHHTLNLTEAEIAKLLGANTALEGQLFPDTYFFTKNQLDLDILQRAFNTMQEKLNSMWLLRNPMIVCKTPYEALILASIVEKESANIHEYADIAAVYQRRLQKNMLLQADPTVIYGLGDKYQGVLTKEGLKIDTPYNTYLHVGLPPTPIAMPSEKALYGVLHPNPLTEALYFVANPHNTGHVFSNTLAEHNIAVQQYREAKNKH